MTMSQDAEQPDAAPADARASIYGIVAEFDTVDAVMRAARAVRQAGYRRFDVHSPFPIHGIDEAMGVRPTVLPWIVLAAGTAGCLGGLTLVIFTMATSFEVPFLGVTGPVEGYQFLISGKPLNSLPAYIPIVFECTILFSAIGAVVGMFLLNLLPKLYNPLFKSPMFRRVTTDRFIIAIEAVDNRFDPRTTAELLDSHAALSVELLEDG